MKRLVKVPKSPYTNEDWERSLLSEAEEEFLLSLEEMLLSDCYNEFHEYGGD